MCFGGETGIRTLGRFPFNGFQDRRNRPLCHLSVADFITERESLQTLFLKYYLLVRCLEPKVGWAVAQLNLDYNDCE